ncbi:MAG: hypothetical protein HYR97_00040 [Candidatus Melainabacteria bacterium]|nr:hypothetical protein [Candidatus Melainabacteria bacterium]MBI3308913.1 hypothetical protein [Candidatus Melainabacteria bacterium]
MSLSLAITKIAQHTSAMESLSQQIAEAEAEHIKAAGGKDPDAVKVALAHLTRLKTLFGMAKDFVEFWKDVIKTILGLIKATNELAQGAR